MSDKTDNLLRRAEADTEEKTSIASAERKFNDQADAEEAFLQRCEKLLQIDSWNSYSGVASFALLDENGGRAEARPAKIGDFLSIKLPATGKVDWVKVINIYKGADEIILTVQPTYNPTEDAPDKSVTSHFFTADSTNNFCLQLNGDVLKMYVIGLNEISNTKDTSNVIESARNFATANLGHFLGVQKMEWTTFCRNFLEVEKEK